MPVARYIDWIFTAPLMLYELCHLGGAGCSTTLLIIGNPDPNPDPTRTRTRNPNPNSRTPEPEPEPEPEP